MNEPPTDFEHSADRLRAPLSEALRVHAAQHGASITWPELRQRIRAARRRRRAVRAVSIAAILVLGIVGFMVTERTRHDQPLKTVDSNTTISSTATGPTTGVPSTRSSVTTVPTQTPAPQFRALQFVSRRTGFVVGSNGTILRTDDAGRTWHHNRTDVAASFSGNADLFSISMLNADTGWIEGPHVDLFTTDGWHWFEASNGAAARPMYRVHFWSPTNGLGIAGTWATDNGHDTTPSDGVLVRSTDGGRRWRVVPSAPNPVQSMCATGPHDAWAANSDFVWHSTDDGVHWQNTLPAPERDSQAELQCTPNGAWVQYTTGSATGGRVGYVLYRTQDRGLNWDAVLEEPMTMRRIRAPAGPGTSRGPFSVIDKDTAFVTGPVAADGHTYSQLVTEGHRIGPTRLIPPFDTPLTGGGASLEDVSFVDSDHGWAAGEVAGQAVIAATTNGGISWTTQYP